MHGVAALSLPHLLWDHWGLSQQLCQGLASGGVTLARELHTGDVRAGVTHTESPGICHLQQGFPGFPLQDYLEHFCSPKYMGRYDRMIPFHACYSTLREYSVVPQLIWDTYPCNVC